MQNSRPEVLDATCGGRMMWFQKNYDRALYNDNTPRPPGSCPQQAAFTCDPDTVDDFRDLPQPDASFNLVVFDPPHRCKLADGTITWAKFGGLTEDWQGDIKRGFDECWRVLRPGGTLIFKWNEASFSVRETLELLGEVPLFGHTTARSGKTKWMCFYKPEVG